MGKPTREQMRSKAESELRAQRRVPKEGVTITRANGSDDVFEGDFEAQLTPTGVVCVIELVPDLLNQNKGQAIPVIRKFINSREWLEVIVK